jgi:hypothetical protein
MLRLNAEQRSTFGEKLLDLANLAATALVFGQFVGQAPPSWMVMVGGVGVWVALVSVALWLKGVG